MSAETRPEAPIVRMRDVYDNFSPLDYRYDVEELHAYLTEKAFTAYKCRVEVALVKTLHARGLCAESVVREVEAACDLITTAEVYAEEDRIKHDIRALVNCIQRRVSDDAKPFVHMTATSYDIVDTANAARFKDAALVVAVPKLKGLIRELIKITRREAETLQVGRTHGQHAVPITFGFAMAGYVSRLGRSAVVMEELSQDLRGKMAGAVGAYNASSLFFDDARAFEADVLRELGLRPGDHATQIVQPEPLLRLFMEMGIAAGIMANLCRDLRNLQRTEISEVGEEFSKDQVGSSTMPQKRNPISFENVESIWKVIKPRLQMLHDDQVSDHQRDLTNSASGRTYAEIVCYFVYMTKRLTGTLKKLRVDATNLGKNFAVQQGLIAAEPLYIILASLGHPDAHEAVRKLTLESQRSGHPLANLIFHADEGELTPYLARMTDAQREILRDPSKYTGIAAERALAIVDDWLEKLGLTTY